MQERFFNLIDVLGSADRSTPAAEAASVRATIESILRRPEITNVGGMLYIPRRDEVPGRPGAWLVDVTTDLILPPLLELRLAPGAALAPIALSFTEGGALEIRGPLSAPLGSLFATSVTLWRWRDDLGELTYSVRPVRLTGSAMERVHPEWWGAGSGTPGVDGPALAAAVRAAHADRWIGTRPLPSLVVELSQRYELLAPLEIDGVSTRGVHPSVLALRGLPGASDTPHLTCAPDGPSPGDALLVARNVVLSLEDVRFDGQMRAPGCLRIESQPASTPLDGTGSRLRQCVLRNATDVLLHVVVGRDGNSPDLGQGPALTVEGGLFEPHRASSSSDALAPLAVRLIGPSSATVEFRSVAFSGEARAMIHASSCMLSITHCAFQNDAVPQRTGNDPALLDTLHATGPENGVDLLLDALPNDLAASVSAMHCSSTSLQFLVARGATPGTGVRDSSIVGLHHDARRLGVLRVSSAVRTWVPQPPISPPGLVWPYGPGKGLLPAIPLLIPTITAGPGLSSDDPATHVPAILWDGQSQGGATFTLSGCRFDRTGARTSTTPAVSVRNQVRPVVDLGAVRGDPQATFPIFDAMQRAAPEPVNVWV